MYAYKLATESFYALKLIQAKKLQKQALNFIRYMRIWTF